MKVSGRKIRQFLNNPAPDVRAVLLYGPDAGLVRERADGLVTGVAGDPGDPFRVAELSPDEVVKEPARLFDEAAAIAMTGGRRALRLRGPGDGLSDVFSRFLADPPGDGLVVLEAGDLPPRSKLRKLFETADRAAALPCYRDEGRDLEALVEDMARKAGYRMTREARAYLVVNLGGDRLVTRREMEKLLLYMGPASQGTAGDGAGQNREITLADVQACVGDSAERSLDDLVFALGDRNVPEIERTLTRVFQEGSSWVAPLRAAARHFERLHRVAGAMAGGAAAESAMARLRPPVFWKHRSRFQHQLQDWSPELLTRSLARLTEAELEGKRGRMAGEVV
ncbi:MAG: DNA polymerase III subunit delta [Kiloniellales bacterium]|nr:DNA polymerase III subunit delta [Kiloniellales bacterium]